MSPIIGITSVHDWKEGRVRQNETYIRAVEKAGGTPVLLPPMMNMNIIDQYLGVIDGLLVAGGPDIAPIYFNEEPIKEMENISPAMDFFEVNLIRRALKKGVPILGICRGLQVLNVVMGGTLYQDIHKQTDSTMQHNQMAPRDYATHNATVERGSMLYELLGDVIRVNSYHHQAIKDVAKGLKVVARASDGIIEAVEGEGDNFVMGVQWHPEGMWQSTYNYDKIFERFIRESSK